MKVFLLHDNMMLNSNAYHESSKMYGMKTKLFNNLKSGIIFFYMYITTHSIHYSVKIETINHILHPFIVIQ